MDNLYSSCPAKMAYGGPWTDYRPHCVVNSIMTTENTLMNSEEYRKNMIANGEKIMQDNRQTVESMYSCASCVPPEIPSEATTQTCWNNVCTFTPSMCGLGIGIGKGRM